MYCADLGYGPKPWLIVSNDSRNRRLADNYLGVLSPATMDKVNRALAIALGLP